VKRSRQVTLVLLGGVATGLLTACSPYESNEPRVTTESYYANNHFIKGAGYYHAPFRAFYPLPYNSFDGVRGAYYAGGNWNITPYNSVINVSAPTAAASAAAQAGREVIARQGFGGTGYRLGTWS
jgi:hypothetical protein